MRAPYETKLRALKLLREGKSVLEVAQKLRITYNCVYQMNRNLAAYDDYEISETNRSLKVAHWTPEQINLLKDRFQYLPPHFVHTQQFIDLCEHIGKSTHAVKTMIGRLNLTQNAPVEPPPVKKMSRPQAVYTNIQTPYGIATELHAGNRIYQNK